MSRPTSNDQAACFAMLKSLWIDGNDYISPFERMLITLFHRSSITSIKSVDWLCSLFYDTWKIELPHMPMLHILGRLHTRGIIERPKYSNNYTVNLRGIVDSDIISESKISQLEDKFENIVNECLAFALSKFPHIISTRDQIRNELVSFLSQQASDLALNGAKTATIEKNPKNAYRVGKYLEHLQSEDKGKLQFLNDIAVGHILSKCIEIDETSSGNLHGLTIYFDTGFIYSLLGIDMIDRRIVYENLTKNLYQMGASLKVFQHNIDEINSGLDTAISWVGNPLFDPALASKTSLYFRDINASTSDILEIQTTYISELRETYHIELDGGAYLPVQDVYNHDEKVIEEAIYKEYSLPRDGGFRPINTDNIAVDAKSANKILRYREGITSPNLSECGFVFVTTNISFAKAIKNYERSTNFADNCIAACITDSLVGTIVWLSQPAKILEDSYARLIALAHAAFIPSEKVLIEFSKQLAAAQRKGTITPQLCYHMRTAPAVRNMLMDISAGYPSNVVETTPEEILRQIHDAGLEEGKKQTEVEYETLLQNSKTENVQQMLFLYSQETVSLLENLRIVQIAICQQENLRNAAIKKFESRKLGSIMSYIIGTSIIIAGGIVFSLKFDRLFGIIMALLPFIAFTIGNIYFMFRAKKIDFLVLYTTHLKKIEKRVFNFLSYNPITLIEIKTEETRLTDRIALLRAAMSDVMPEVKRD